ncbi:T9SS type A sorting domain-containing protein [Phaeocystidibacter luteus]|uniref:T9SS type A sorting domain-containing protein n=1 Tax=Phaeocystidibacter luteus TaxID=911197 RepID=A0A6N6RKP7_9FLAO|nr:T9SS type A sorting domain-containing protein [Phaeocystidibacter luteus]KAB2813690.1 T9SS type A sorting domain-containing protein [Phaeocystidibacter luteus]
MKKIFMLTLIASFISSISFGQETERYLNPHTFTYSTSCAVLGNHLYLNVGNHGYFNWDAHGQAIIKLNDSLEVIDSVDISGLNHHRNNESLYVEKIESINGQLHVLLTSFYYVGNSYPRYEAVILKVDSFLNILDTIILGSDSLNISLADISIANGKIFYTGAIWDTAYANQRSLIIQQSFDSSIERFESVDIAGDKSYPVHFADLTMYNDSVFAISMISAYDYYRPLTFLDTNMNVISTIKIQDPIKPEFGTYNEGYFVRSNDSTTRLITTVNHFSHNLPPPVYADFYYNLGVVNLTSQFQVQSIDTFAFSGANTHLDGTLNTMGVKPRNDAISMNNTDSCFIAIAGQEVFGSHFEIKPLNEVYLYNLNTNTNTLNWSRIYTRHSTGNQISTDILPGNRYVLVLNEYDWTNYSSPNTSVHVMILDNQGSILSERAFVREAEVDVYPNPASDYFSINLPHAVTSAEFSILDLNGRCLHSGKASSGKHIPIHDLPPGKYVVKIKTELGPELINSLVIKQP